MRDAGAIFSWNGYDNVPLGGNRVSINIGDYDLTTELQTAFTDTKYNIINLDMSDDEISFFTKTLKNDKDDHTKKSNSKRTKSTEKDLRKRVNKI